MTIELTYTGGGYIPGVPARDLTTEEAAQHREVIEREQAASNTVLYVPVAPMQARRVKPEQAAGEVTNG
jgi:hypothetical protein